MSASPADEPTQTSVFPSVAAAAAAPDNEERFLPGTILAGRYRIVNLLGRGGMGEVYRATDLVLQQTVALKFLPAISSSDSVARTRFLNEARAAREITHPNVCRVHDIAEIDGQLYLSMEFVDGEDLSSLLSRIGRLPTAKANELAAGMCAGLAAAHRKGLLHRDLKPANIMIDGRGLPRLMDFGLAADSRRIASNEVRHGTPSYMAPEQLAGKEVTVRSDLYALGLILYELYTGKRPFEAPTVDQLLALRERGNPPEPSTLCPDIDASTERVILDCLAPDPARRPASAAAVAARLPHKDAIAAVLAAGDTPSPELLAASGDTTALRPTVAWTWAAAVLIGLAAGIVLKSRHAGQVPDQPPEILAHGARMFAAQIGYADAPTASAYGFERGDDLHTNFWYRESNADLQASAFSDIRFPPGRVTATDPPMAPGTLFIESDPRGQLRRFVAIPSTLSGPSQADSPIDWNPLFGAAGLDPARFSSGASPPLTDILADSTFSWTGIGADGSSKLRILAASVGARAVYFEIKPELSPPLPSTAFQRGFRAGRAAAIGLPLAVFGGALCLFAYWNIRKRRTDRKGAFLVASALFWISIVQWLFTSRHSHTLHELTVAAWAICWALGNAAVAWVCFIAAEPNVRRLAPNALVTVQKVLTGVRRDAQVGRDLLWGMLVAVFFSTLLLSALSLGGVAPGNPAGFTARGLVSLCLGDLRVGAFVGLLAMMLVVPIVLRFKKKKARFGVLTILIVETGYFVLLDLPPLGDFSAWYAAPPLFAYALLAAFTIHAARLATGAGLRPTQMEARS